MARKRIAQIPKKKTRQNLPSFSEYSMTWHWTEKRIIEFSQILPWISWLSIKIHYRNQKNHDSFIFAVLSLFMVTFYRRIMFLPALHFFKNIIISFLLFRSFHQNFHFSWNIHSWKWSSPSWASFWSQDSRMTCLRTHKPLWISLWPYDPHSEPLIAPSRPAMTAASPIIPRNSPVPMSILRLSKRAKRTRYWAPLLSFMLLEQVDLFLR